MHRINLRLLGILRTALIVALVRHGELDVETNSAALDTRVGDSLVGNRREDEGEGGWAQVKSGVEVAGEDGGSPALKMKERYEKLNWTWLVGGGWLMSQRCLGALSRLGACRASECLTLEGVNKDSVLPKLVFVCHTLV